MEFEVLILSDKFLSGQLPFSWHKFLSTFAKNGASIRNLVCKNYAKQSLTFDKNMVVLAENKNLDELILENLKALTNDKQIVDNLAAIFRKDGNTIIFLPIDVETENLLEKALNLTKNGQKTCKFQLFGLTTDQICERMQSVEGVEFKVTGQNLLCNLYVSYSGQDGVIDDKQVEIAKIFHDNIFSENDLDLGANVSQILNLKNLTIAISEGVTGGKILSCLSLCESFSSCLKAGQVTKSTQGLDSEKLYSSACQFLKDTSADVVLSIDGEFDENGLKIIMALGDRRSIGVYKNRFNGTREDCIEMASNCALYHLVKKLRQNDFAF